MKRELWLRLRHYRFDHLVPAHLSDRVVAVFGRTDSSTRAFAGKVAGKQGWTIPYALHAIAEYKRFVYLGMIAEFSVTPSRAIDAVWHEHLLFSHAYRDFCRDVLGRDFDHHPELMPERGQTDVFQSQYTATLALYREEFNAAPPADVWALPKFRTLHATYAAPPRRRDAGNSGSFTVDDLPLHAYFEGSGSGSSHATGESAFGGAGGFSGGGGGSDWATDAVPDSGASDAGGSGDGGGGDGGGSGCSSSCGGGGE